MNTQFSFTLCRFSLWKMVLFLFVLFAFQTADAQKKVSILGDSYSAYYQHITPATNAWWYSDNGPVAQNDVKKVEEMWWHLLITHKGYKLETNNSFSGSTVCYTGYNGAYVKNTSFVTRMTNLGFPDIVLILGGTNDCWARAPLGKYQYSDWSEKDLESFRPAFCYMLSQLKDMYPKAQIVNIVNSELTNDITTSMDSICRYYRIKNVLLHDIEKQTNHPSVAGMKSISEQVEAVLE